MLNKTLAKMLKESYEEFAKIEKDFDDLTEALDNNTIPKEEIIDRVGIMSKTYNDWKAKHEILMSLGYATSDAEVEAELKKLIEEEEA